MNGVQSGPKQRQRRGQLLLLLALLGGTLSVLCYQGYLPYEVFFANDSALGAMKESSARLPGAFTGYWGDFWWIGGATPSASPSFTTLLLTLLPPEQFLKVFVPVTVLFLGFSAWFFFRQLGFSPLACVLAGVGAGLNMHFFSNACWGLGTWSISAGMVFVALGVLVSPHVRPLWVKGALAGLSVGMVVMEGFDLGAILSIYIGIFLAFLFLTTEANPASGALKTLGVGALVVFFAFFISASTLYTLVGTQITGTANGGESDRDKQSRWDFTTQWSIPKLETLRVFIPGVFGYRLREFTTSQDKSGSYWGTVAEDPRVVRLGSPDPKVRAAAAAFLGLQQQVQDVFAGNDVKTRQEIIDQVKGQVQLRHTGSGEYTGLLVCLLAAFGLASSLRGIGSPYSANERRMIWFWAVAAVFSLLAAWGWHGFVYQFIYRLPFLSNIRNPMKFMHPLNICLIILCGFGLEALWRGYLQRPADRSCGLGQLLRTAWKRVSGFEKSWVIASVVLFLASIVSLLLLMASKPDLINYLEHNGFGKDLAPSIAGFCVKEVGLFVVYLALSTVVMASILTGAWAGNRVAVAWVFLAAIMICDLSRSDVPWIRYFNYKQKYSMNPVVDLLRREPWEHRVVSRGSPMGGYDLSFDPNFGGLCHWWLENDYPYNDIQCLEIDQAPRMPVLDGSYLGDFNARTPDDVSPAALQWLNTHPRDNNPNNPNNFIWNWVVQAGPEARLWRLTNTRYIFADARLADVLNQFADPPNSFRTVMRMDMVVKPGVTQVEDAGDMTVSINTNGELALIEFTRALPRTKLYSNWQVLDDPTTLHQLASRQFDPEKTVIIATNSPALPTPGSPEADPGTVKITHYRPKDLILEAEAKTPAVLLLNDRSGDWWNVWVDQKPSAVLRCNYIMRGVFLPAGRHTIEFRFQPPLTYLYISLAAVAIGVLLAGYEVCRHFFWRVSDSPAPAS
ncbi:MAG: hypothetical protein ABSG59_07550 [Verrucomicrobiota bacterium]|jgi:hypothetical protein